MNTIPAAISPEVAAWVQAQITINNARTASLLRQEIDKVDDWANGLFAALVDILPFVLQLHPDMPAELGQRWGEVADQFDALQAGEPVEESETLEALEGRKMLYRIFQIMGLWQ